MNGSELRPRKKVWMTDACECKCGHYNIQHVNGKCSICNCCWDARVVLEQDIRKACNKAADAGMTTLQILDVIGETVEKRWLNLQDTSDENLRRLSMLIAPSPDATLKQIATAANTLGLEPHIALTPNPMRLAAEMTLRGIHALRKRRR